MNKESIVWTQHLPRLKKPPLDKRMAMIVLGACAKMLDLHGCDYWLSGGTMLGAYRDKDFITGDYDIDVEMTGDSSKVVAAIDKLAPRYRTLRHIATDRIIQEMWQFPDNTLFDLYFYYPEDRGLVSYTPYSDQEIIYPPDFKKTTIEFKGRLYPCWEPERYLKYVYGDNWKTPSNVKSVYGNS